jgi:hypothetical protein
MDGKSLLFGQRLFFVLTVLAIRLNIWLAFPIFVLNDPKETPTKTTLPSKA